MGGLQWRDASGFRKTKLNKAQHHARAHSPHINIQPLQHISQMTPAPDAIADCVLAAFDQLPARRKPRPRGDGEKEWVPLSGIVLAKGTITHPLEFQ
jgi:hypothetical protein